MDKREKEIRKNIAKRLRMSDKERWEKLSDEDVNSIIDEYLHLSSIEEIGIHRVLEDNRNVRRNIGMLMLGSFIGVSGGIAGNITLDYIRLLPTFFKIHYELALVVLFIALIVELYFLIDVVGADGFKEDRILEHLQKRVKDKSNPKP